MRGTDRKDTGFIAPAARPLGGERRTTLVAELVATLALTLGTIVAASVITAGIARADTAGALGPTGGSLTALALIMAFLFAGMGGLTAVTLRVERRRKPPRR